MSNEKLFNPRMMKAINTSSVTLLTNKSRDRFMDYGKNKLANSFLENVYIYLSELCSKTKYLVGQLF